MVALPSADSQYLLKMFINNCSNHVMRRRKYDPISRNHPRQASLVACSTTNRLQVSGVARAPQAPRPRGAREAEGARRGPPGAHQEEEVAVTLGQGPKQVVCGGARKSSLRHCCKWGVLVYKCLHNLAPPYLMEMVLPVSHIPGWRMLRSSAHGDVIVPRTESVRFGPRALDPHSGTVFQLTWKLQT